MPNSEVFPELNIDRLKALASKWVKDFQDDIGISIKKVNLFEYRAPVYVREVMANRLRDKETGSPFISRLKYAVVFELNCEGEKPTVEILHNIDLTPFFNYCKFIPYANFIDRYTSHLSGKFEFPPLFRSGFDNVYKDPTKKNYEEEWTFLPYCKGITLPSSVRTDEHSLVLHGGNLPNKKRDHFTIPVPPRTLWTQIHFRIVHSDRVEVTYPGGMKPFSPDEIGLLRKKRLHSLFENFAEEAYQKADRIDISDLNKFLKKMFPDIDDGNPIVKAKPGKKSLKEKKDQLKLKNPTGYTPVFSIQPE